MQAMKLQIGLARFPYAGNGATESESPRVSEWMAAFKERVKNDPRCGVAWYDLSLVLMNTHRLMRR